MSRTAAAVQALRVGVVVVLGLILTAGAIWVLGDAQRLWSKKVTYRVRYRDVQGLAAGSTVSLAGYRIGTIKRMYLPDDITEGRVEIILSVDRENQRYIREDTRARINRLGLLGDRYIELSPGTPAAAELPEGREIVAIEPPNIEKILAQGETLADNLAALSVGLRSIVEKIDQGKGLLGAMISDTPEAQQTMEDFKATLANIRSVTHKIDQGQGMAASLINDRKMAGQLRATIDSLARVAKSLEEGEGLLPKLLNDADFARQVSDDLEAAAHDVRALAHDLHEGKGIVPRLVTDAELADDLLSSLRSATKSLSEVSERINSGEGSLGKMINDETLYEGINDILAGARKSRLTRWFLSRSQKAGADERLQQDARSPTPPPGAPAEPPAPASAR